MQAVGTENQENHQPVVIGQRLGHSGAPANDGTAAIAADDVLRHECLFRAVAIDDIDGRVDVILTHGFASPAVHNFDRRDLCCAPAQNRFGRVLRQSLVAGEIE
jgi:hypothetical protein